MNYEGEKFLLKLYKELYNEKSVKHSSTKSDNKYEAIRKYMDRLERVHNKVESHNALDLLKVFYYAKYVIKKENIPESYMNYLDNITFKQYGYHMTVEEKNRQKALIIEGQKKSLNEWLDYLVSNETNKFPVWVKYWVFQGMITIGNYDTNKENYNKRSQKTVAPFPELDKEIAFKLMNLMVNEVKGNEIDDKCLEALLKNGSFFKLYTIQLMKKRKRNFNDEIRGKWVKYEQGDNYKELLESIQGKNTGWCTRSEDVCKYQISNGDFYVYYTYDEEGNATNPRLAIRMNGKNKIEEIRGVGKKENIEPHFENIIAEKLKEFPDAEHYKKRIKDTKILTYIYTKYKTNKPLTEDDLEFIYEINDKVETMGLEKDPRLREMENNTLNRRCETLTKETILKDIRCLRYLDKNAENSKEIAIDIVKQDKCSWVYIPKEMIDQDILSSVKRFSSDNYLNNQIKTVIHKALDCFGEISFTRKR